MNAAGKVECTGVLQQIVMRSWSTRRYHFYYRVRTTSGSGAITQIWSSGFGSPQLTTNVAYRKDLPAGSYSLTSAGRNPFGPVSFMFYHPIPCTNGDTPYLLVKTNADNYQFNTTEIITTTANSAQVTTLGP